MEGGGGYQNRIPSISFWGYMWKRCSTFPTIEKERGMQEEKSKKIRREKADLQWTPLHEITGGGVGLI